MEERNDTDAVAVDSGSVESVASGVVMRDNCN
jgi:hypothetical protein